MSLTDISIMIFAPYLAVVGLLWVSQYCERAIDQAAGERRGAAEPAGPEGGPRLELLDERLDQPAPDGPVSLPPPARVGS